MNAPVSVGKDAALPEVVNAVLLKKIIEDSVGNHLE
jgi:hypothetical protein